MKTEKRIDVSTIMLSIIVVFVAVPVIIALMIKTTFFVTDISNDWIGFWGGYLGAIIGGLITLYVLEKTLKENRESQKREERIDFCNHITEISGQICTAVNKEMIFILKATEENKKNPIIDDVYRALLAKNDALGAIQVCSSLLLAKIGSPDYSGVQELMDFIYDLQLAEEKIDIKMTYSVEEGKKLDERCKKVSEMLGAMRDYTANFTKVNESWE